jgi:hypothetical protein
MRTAIGLLAGWLLAALLLLGMDGRLPEFLAVATSGSLLVLGVGALVRQQLAPSRYNRPSIPERYRVADDLRRPLADVVAVAEADASALTGWSRNDRIMRRAATTCWNSMAVPPDEGHGRVRADRKVRR